MTGAAAAQAEVAAGTRAAAQRADPAEAGAAAKVVVRGGDSAREVMWGSN